MTLHYIDGDATYPERTTPNRSNVIAHVCNDIGAWGRGFVMAISTRFPQARTSYLRAIREGGKLGDLYVFGREDWGCIVVAHMIAQKGVGRGKRRVQYGPLRQCLGLLADYAKAQHTHPAIHMPRIGCGLGGGSWEEIGPIVEDRLKGLDVYVYGRKRGGVR